MEELRIVSVNIGQSESIQLANRMVPTGINKQPVPHSVHIGPAGLKDDVICDEEHHGGADQAVYVYGASDYEWWAKRLKRNLGPGTFGENLTVAGLPGDMNAGDRLLIGNLILEVTAPRIPCGTLSAKMHIGDFGLQFRRAERPGFYFRVLNEGEVTVGDAVTIVEDPNDGISMLELFRLSYEPQPSAEDLRLALESPISERMRAKFEARLASIEE